MSHFSKVCFCLAHEITDIKHKKQHKHTVFISNTKKSLTYHPPFIESVLNKDYGIALYVLFEKATRYYVFKITHFSTLT